MKLFSRLAFALVCLFWFQMAVASIALAFNTPITSQQQRTGVAMLCGHVGFGLLIAFIHLGFLYAVISLKSQPTLRLMLTTSIAVASYLPFTLLMGVA